MRLEPRELLVLFAVGAAGGLVGDAGHVEAGTTTYLDDSVPFVWKSALWFPILVGLATASTGELRLRLGAPRPGFDPRTAIGAIAAVLSIYAITALTYDEPLLATTVLISMLAVGVVCWLADGRPAIVCALAAAVVGPIAEIVIVELELSEYAGSADELGGVALWLPALYFAFGAVAARLAELLVALRRFPRHSDASERASAASSSPR